MTKSELIQKVAKANKNLTRKQAEMVIDVIFDAIKSALSRGEKVEIRDFGSFKVKKKEGRKARNPKTGVVVDVEPKKVPYFKVGKELKEMVKKYEQK
ncbi:MAG: integration host factor subunit beta [Nitrospirae bacterium]|nr:MAG: integration host factor subunit beta [Nitrospirota bacterium]